jgi:hypothetical protein
MGSCREGMREGKDGVEIVGGTMGNWAEIIVHHGIGGKLPMCMMSCIDRGLTLKRSATRI